MPGGRYSVDFAVAAAVGKFAASRDDPGSMTLSHCFAHVRRKYLDTEPAYPEATQVLDWILDLYKIEARARESDTADRRALTAPCATASRGPSSWRSSRG